MRVVTFVAAFVLAASAAVPSSVFAGPDRDPNVSVVERFHAALLSTMKQGKTLGINGRYKKLEPEVASDFDLAAMTQYKIGRAHV